MSPLYTIESTTVACDGRLRTWRAGSSTVKGAKILRALPFEKATEEGRVFFTFDFQLKKKGNQIAITEEYVFEPVSNTSQISRHNFKTFVLVQTISHLTPGSTRFLVFAHVTSALTTVAIHHVGAQTNALNREITVLK